MKRAFRILIILIVFIVLFIFLNRLLEPKYSTDLIEGSMIDDYYESEFDHEVIFIGDCEVYTNFSPMEMYSECGIKSFVRGGSGETVWQEYYILEETLKHETPKVVVMGVNNLRYDRSYTKESYNRLLIDNMKWSKVKGDLINDSMTEDETFLSYVFPILRYHSRWSELSKEDFKYFFKNTINTYNGFLVNKDVKGMEFLPTKKALATYGLDVEAMEYLSKINTLCIDNNIKLVLVKGPCIYPYWYDEYNEQIEEFSEKYNIDYYNLMEKTDEIGIDFSTDTYDEGQHLNLSGATKLSKYFAEILSNNYDLEDFRGDAIYEEKLEEYIENTNN